MLVTDDNVHAELKQAAARIAPYVRHTPLLPSGLSQNLIVKPECLQVSGSFKARGAFNALLHLREQRPEISEVGAVSSG